MKEIKELIQTHKHIIIILLLAFCVAILGVPFLINYLFKLPAANDILSAEWQAEDVLSYYGAILTFLGTGILSILALVQNNTINQLNLQHTSLLEQMEKEKNAPFFVAKYVAGGPLASDLVIKLENISDNLAQQVTICECKVIDNQEELPIPNFRPLKKEYIGAHQEAEFRLGNDSLPQRESLICFSIHYQDIFGKILKCRVTGNFSDENDNMSFTIVKEMQREMKDNVN